MIDLKEYKDNKEELRIVCKNDKVVVGYVKDIVTDTERPFMTIGLYKIKKPFKVYADEIIEIETISHKKMNLWDYAGYGYKIKITCTDGNVYEGHVVNVCDELDDEELEEMDITIERDTYPKFLGVSESDIKYIEILDD